MLDIVLKEVPDAQALNIDLINRFHSSQWMRYTTVARDQTRCDNRNKRSCREAAHNQETDGDLGCPKEPRNLSQVSQVRKTNRYV